MKNNILSKILMLLQPKKNERSNAMATSTQKRKFDKFKYAFGQIYRGYLESGKKDQFVITNVHVREWLGVLSYFKKKEYIVDFRLGDTIETACDLGIKGFDLDKVDEEQYLKYGNGVLNNYIKEMAEEKKQPKRKGKAA